jgi:hypothetical protein
MSDVCLGVSREDDALGCVLFLPDVIKTYFMTKMQAYVKQKERRACM